MKKLLSFLALCFSLSAMTGAHSSDQPLDREDITTENIERKLLSLNKSINKVNELIYSDLTQAKSMFLSLEKTIDILKKFDSMNIDLFNCETRYLNTRRILESFEKQQNLPPSPITQKIRETLGEMQQALGEIRQLMDSGQTARAREKFKEGSFLKRLDNIKNEISNNKISYESPLGKQCGSISNDFRNLQKALNLVVHIRHKQAHFTLTLALENVTHETLKDAIEKESGRTVTTITIRGIDITALTTERICKDIQDGNGIQVIFQ
jgi:hypothetical protein